MPAEDRRLAVIVAGHRGEPGDLELVRQSTADEDPLVRAAVLGALARLDQLNSDDLLAALRDPDPSVRQRAAHLAGRRAAGIDPSDREDAGDELDAALRSQLGDDVPICVISALEAIGSRGDRRAVEVICSLATQHPDPMVVEEAVATLAELGDPAGLPVILAMTSGKPALRRRVVAALGAFEGPEVDAALDALSQDRDWQVRQAVAMLRREELD
jgi:HEAT repeat protein